MKKTTIFLIALLLSAFSFSQTTALFPGSTGSNGSMTSGSINPLKMVTATAVLTEPLSVEGGSDNIVFNENVEYVVNKLNSNSLSVVEFPNASWPGTLANYASADFVDTIASNFLFVFSNEINYEVSIPADSTLSMNSSIEAFYLSGQHPTILGAGVYDSEDAIKAIVTGYMINGESFGTAREVLEQKSSSTLKTEFEKVRAITTLFDITFVTVNMVTDSIISELGGELPVANFYGTPTAITVGESVNFTDLSTGNPTGWEWIFEGGTPATSTEQSPAVTYNTAGIYDVTLIATNENGSHDTIKENFIIVSDGGGGLWANFWGYPQEIYEGESVQFYDDSQGNPVNWNWTLEGAGTATAQNPLVTYNTAGVYDVTLVIENANGEISSITKEDYITVKVFVWAPVAAFTAIPTEIMEGASAQFTDQSLNNPTSWYWTFEGGIPATSTDPNPLVTYDTAGVYNVMLIVFNEGGNSTLIKNDFITVNPLVSDTIELVESDMWTWNINPNIGYPNDNVEHEYIFSLLPDSLEVFINGKRTSVSWETGTTFSGNFSIPDSMATGYIEIYLSVWKNGINVVYEITSNVYVMGYDEYPLIIRLKANHRYDPSPQGGNVYQATNKDPVFLESSGAMPKRMTMLGQDLNFILNNEELWVAEIVIDEWNIKRGLVDFVIEYDNGNILNSTTDGSSVMLIPLNPQLFQNKPNPVIAGSPTIISFELEERSFVKVEVYNILSQTWDVLLIKTLEAGYHEVLWIPNHIGIGLYRITMTAKGTPILSFTKKAIITQ